MDALWAVPEWAPAGATHLLGSSSAITHIDYAPGRLRYATFDAASEDVLRLGFVPRAVRVDGRALQAVHAGAREGYRYDPATGVLRIRHRAGHEVEVEGVAPEGGAAVGLATPAARNFSGGFDTP